jgi:hypothetical protein
MKIKTVTFLLILMSISMSRADDVPFNHVIIDGEGPNDPWAKIIADIDNDGFPDLVIGGRKGPLVWYRYPNWAKTVITKGG